MEQNKGSTVETYMTSYIGRNRTVTTGVSVGIDKHQIYFVCTFICFILITSLVDIRFSYTLPHPSVQRRIP
jgi:hypothetical protein